MAGSRGNMGFVDRKKLKIFEDHLNSFDQVINNIKGLVWNFTKNDTITKGLRIEDIIFNWEQVIR